MVMHLAYITLCFSLSREALRVRDLAQFLFYKSITQISLSNRHRAFSITISGMGKLHGYRFERNQLIGHVKMGLTDLRDSRCVPIVLIEAFIVLL